MSSEKCTMLKSNFISQERIANEIFEFLSSFDDEIAIIIKRLNDK